ncbi:hypothetical protein GH714_025719 [Hevea brasiliensis]|uniref:Uncharacterized protein n=1 Tax=Hevea brasiliensis TaxID=3981 RepID=A0A6A6M9P5_HEVBR|nr:hypothetical protein GH714_025719 [Hevea brasiliensis]
MLVEADLDTNVHGNATLILRLPVADQVPLGCYHLGTSLSGLLAMYGLLAGSSLSFTFPMVVVFSRQASLYSVSLRRVSLQPGALSLLEQGFKGNHHKGGRAIGREQKTSPRAEINKEIQEQSDVYSIKAMNPMATSAPSVFEQGFKGNHHKGRRDITSEQQTSPRAENNKEIQEQSNASPTKARSPMGAGAPSTFEQGFKGNHHKVRRAIQSEQKISPSAAINKEIQEQPDVSLTKSMSPTGAGAPLLFEQGFKGNHRKGRRDIESEQKTSPRARNNKEIHEQLDASATKALSAIGAPSVFQQGFKGNHHKGASSVFEQGFKGNHKKGRMAIQSEQKISPRAVSNKEIQKQLDASSTKSMSPMGAGPPSVFEQGFRGNHHKGAPSAFEQGFKGNNHKGRRAIEKILTDNGEYIKPLLIGGMAFISQS